MLGYHDDPRIQERIAVLLADERHDGGSLCNRPSFKAKTKSCIRGSIKALMAFAVLPELWETARCRQLVDYFLRRRVLFRTGSRRCWCAATGAHQLPLYDRLRLLEPLYH
jgi:hypothetical protein